MSEWKEVTIEEIKANSKGSIAIGPFGSRLKSDNYIPSGIPVIRGTNISSSKEFSGNFVYISKEKALSLGSANVYPNDLVFPHRGAIGEVGLVNGNGNSHYVLSSSLMKLTLDLKKADPNFLFYFFKSNTGRHELLKNVSTVGTPGIGQPLSSLKSIRLNLPPLPEQKAIAHILGKLDDKIELNRQINQTLEAMAQALFKSWFVDFDPVLDNALAAGNPIPDELEAMAEKRVLVPNSKKLISKAPELAALFPSSFVFNETRGKWIPEGWEVMKIKNTGKVITGKTPSSKNPEHFGNIYPFVTPTDFKNYFKLVINSDRKLSQEGYDENIKRILPEGSVLVTCIGSDMGKVVLTKTKCLTNQQINSVVPNIDFISSEYLFQFFQSNYDLLRTLAFGGSTMPILNKTDFENIDILIPTKVVLLKITNTLKSYDNKILSNLKQTETLIELRDTLLPELISGRVSVKEALN